MEIYVVPNFNNNTDYNKPHQTPFDLLPSTLQNDTNKSIFGNLFDRFLTKQEVLKVAGYIGVGNPNAIKSRRIEEPTLHRQAFQLQPIITTKIGSVEHAASWVDIQNELSRTGINMEDYDEWGKNTRFNWVPPVDLDKVIHYADYYWYDEDTPNSTPEYITIKSRCATATANANFWQGLVDEFGATIPTIALQLSDVVLDTFPIVSLTQGTDLVTVAGDASSQLISGQFINLTINTNNNGIYQIVTAPIYDANVDETIFSVTSGSFILSDGIGGTLNQISYDKMIISGDSTRLFDPNLAFFYKDSINVELNDTFFVVVESNYNITTDTTTIQFNGTTSDPYFDGVISLEETLKFYQSERDCLCTGSVGWDLLLWDDNESDPIWNNPPGSVTDPDSHATLLSTISNVGVPVGIPVNIPLWYDTTTDIVYQYEDTPLNTGWKLLWNSFSNLLELTEGFALWDLSPKCDVTVSSPTADQWIDRNFWLHESDVPSFSSAKQAQFPILEYDNNLEINEWSFSGNDWKYRSDNLTSFVDTTSQPSGIELQLLSLWERVVVGSDEYIVFDERYGDMSEQLAPGTTIQTSTIGVIFDISSVVYQRDTATTPLRTIITITDDIVSVGLMSGDLTTGRPSTTPFHPNKTSNGDTWRGYGTHWLHSAQLSTVPVPHQPINPETVLPVPVVNVVDPAAGYTYSIGYAVEQFTVTSASTLQIYQLHHTPLIGSSRSLRRRSLVGANDIRVYINEVREYGSYEEIADNTVNIVGLTSMAAGDPSDTIALSESVVGAVSIGDVITIEGNDGVGANGEYDVIGISGSVIVINNATSPLPSTSTISGVISNKTSPISTIGEISYVGGIRFYGGFEPNRFDVVRVEVGAASILGIGNTTVPVRTIESNFEYASSGDEYISVVNYRRVEQVKSSTNQYPLYDIYEASGSPAFKANQIFGYKTSPESLVVPAIGQRIVADFDQRIFTFDQFLLDEDNGKVRAFRDYANAGALFWFNTSTSELMFWDGIQWTERTFMSNQYRTAIVSGIEPTVESSIDGMYWFDTTTLTLYRRDVASSSWDVINGVVIHSSDTTLQSIWRKGLNSEQYIPSKVDWLNRTQSEYDAEQLAFINAGVTTLLGTVTGITTAEATAQTLAEWIKKQTNPLSVSGEWAGEWEIPEPLYYNHLHENRKCLTSTELLTHFTTIIESQEKVPGYTGLKERMFHLLSSDDINYGIGGTIREYGSSFDQLLSSAFVTNTTPVNLIEFAHDQYESLLNTMVESYQSSVVTIMSSTAQSHILDLSGHATEVVISNHETSDFLNLVYNDSTTYSNVSGLGLRNWIATLPYLSLTRKQLPIHLVDSNRGINQVVHHDGHRTDYLLNPAQRSGIIHSLINTPDERTVFPTPTSPPLDVLGVASITLPPSSISEFNSSFNTTIDGRVGVYWYHNASTLYRLILVDIGTIVPSSIHPDGTLWLDITAGLEVLRHKKTNTNTNIVAWEVVPGLVIGDGRLHNGTDPLDVTTSTVSSWQQVNVDELLGDVIHAVELELYSNAPDPTVLRYPILTKPVTLGASAYNTLSLQQFNDYVSQGEIVTPLSNIGYSSADPFTWNYKYSAPGTSVVVLDTDINLNAFVFGGDVRVLFDPCNNSGTCPSTIDFYLKNSTTGNGKWTTIESTLGTPIAIYDPINNNTTVLVQEPIHVNGGGIAFVGLLAGDSVDGSETGSDWREYYQQVYGTPYPNLEPWILQRYADKPDWWDTHYKNTDAATWGNRKWNYKHGFEVVGIDIIDDGFIVNGDFRELYVENEPITLVDTPSGIYDNTFTASPLAVVSSVVLGAGGTASITLPGDFTTLILVGHKFATSDGLGNITGQFTASQVTYSGPPNLETVIIIEEDITNATGIVNVTGSTYDPITSTTKIRVFENLSVNVFGGTIQLHYGMWENIRLGTIPPGESYSNGTTSITGDPIQDNIVYGVRSPDIPTFNFFSVNIDNVDIVVGGDTYSPDDILPPYFDPLVHYGPVISTFNVSNRSLFTDFGNEITSPGSNYTFGDSGPVEWEWRNSSQFLYDQLTIAYKLDPVQVITDTFGMDTYNVAGLPINVDTSTPISHTTVAFHGDVVGNSSFVSNGINQWYTNYNRFNGYDSGFADFRQMWVGWTAPLTYQFATFVDTPSLDIGHRYVDINEYDYSITSKRAPGVEDYWYDVFDVRITSIPPSIQRYDNQLDWGLELTTNLPLSRTISYYDVHNYQFYSNPITGISTMYTWEVVGVDTFDKTFKIQGNQTNLFIPSRLFIVADSTGNDDSYEIINSVYDINDNTTIIELGVIIPSSIVDGTITLNYRSIPWETGDIVYITTAETLPSPLIAETGGGLVPYFIIVDDSINFRLALSKSDAVIGTAIPIYSSGSKDQFVGELRSTFVANGGTTTETLWRHYELDKTNTLSFSTPYGFNGMQELVNIVDGYDVFTYDQGWRINEDNTALDPDTGRILGWQVELERYIDYAYGLRLLTQRVVDKFGVVVSVVNDNWAYTSFESSWITGDPVNVFSDNGVYPSPIVPGVLYYVIRDSASEFRLASTLNNANVGTSVQLLSDVGVGGLQIGPAQNKDFDRHQELNPNKGAIWFRPNRGIVADVIDGPSVDVRNTNLIFDQNGDPIKESNLRVFRQDKVTQVVIINDVNTEILPNDVTPYNLLHFGGIHLFIDAYEHILRFNNYTSEGSLLYDPFIGLNVTKYEMLFNRQTEFTERPNVGGYYLHNDSNQGADLSGNIEASVEALRYAYDTNSTLESTPLTIQSRKGLGYEGTTEYLNDLNLHEKSQFLFWKGLIHTKGSLNTIAAFINSRRFVDAKVDAFWAYELAEFGSSGEKEYPELFVTTTDAKSNDIRWQFVDRDDFCNPGYSDDTLDRGECGYAYPDSGSPVTLANESFSPILITDDDRWYHQPDQVNKLRDNGLNMYFGLTPNNKVNVNFSDLAGHPITSTITSQYQGIDYMTFVVPGVVDVAPKDYIAIRQVSVLENVEYLVETVVIVGSDTHIVVSVAPFTPTSLGTLFVGGSNNYTGWILPSRLDPTYQELLTMDVSSQQWVQSGQWTSTPIDTVHPIIRHNFNADAIKIVVRLYSEGFNQQYTVLSNQTSLLISEFIPHTNGIRVFKRDTSTNNFVQLTASVDYVESLIPDGNGGAETLSNTILFRDGITPSDVIRVVYTSSELIDGVHFETVNSNITRILDQVVFDQATFPSIGDVTLWGLISDKDVHNAAKLIDVEAKTTIAQVQIWDPARNFHNVNAIQNIDLINDVDPAKYNNTPQIQGLLPQQVYGIDPWVTNFVGTTWWDTLNLDYVPYYDNKSIPDIETRFRVWGGLSDWSSIDVYEWVKSDVHPDDWNRLAIREEGDASIPESQRKSGRINKTLFEDDNGTWIVSVPIIQQLDVIVEGTSVGAGLYDLTLTKFQIGDVVDVYINGKAFATSFELTTLTITVEAKESDRVHVIKPIISDQVLIDSAVEAGTHKHDYQFVQMDVRDELNVSVDEYYFWVANKTTRAIDKNRSDAIIGVASKLEHMDAPYMFFQELKQPITYELEGNKQISRIEQHTTTVGQTSITTELPIALDSLVVVSVSGIPIPSSELVYSSGGRVVEFNNIIQPGNQTMEVVYVGLYDDTIDLPLRHVQMISRGLRGIIDAENRYVLRYTKDFTLRDSLNGGSSPLQLKNLHKEWEMFRQNQPYHINRSLWDKVTESIIQYTLADANIRVPSYERQLYDEKHETSTQYGLGAGQAFVSGELALASILADLNAPDNDFWPIDIAVFFERFSFDTPSNIITAMDTIYNTYSFEHVNRMFFSVLHDALSTQPEYEGIMKTSMISLHGIRPFQVNGLYDD